MHIHFSNPLMCLLLFFSWTQQGLVIYNNTKTDLNTSVFNPSQLTENRMLYFWFSDGLLDPLMAAVHHDGRFIRNISGTELMVWNNNLGAVYILKDIFNAPFMCIMCLGVIYIFNCRGCFWAYNDHIVFASTCDK